MAAPSAKLASELSALCQSCGLCCDGSLFHRGRLAPDEVEPAKRNGLRVIRDKTFAQPCSRLENNSCKIYESRPGACRTFTCKLFARHRDEGGPIAVRLNSVRRFRSALAEADRHGVERGANGEVRFPAAGPDAAEATKLFNEIMRHAEEDFARELVSDGPAAS